MPLCSNLKMHAQERKEIDSSFLRSTLTFIILGKIFNMRNLISKHFYKSKMKFQNKLLSKINLMSAQNAKGFPLVLQCYLKSILN